MEFTIIFAVNQAWALERNRYGITVYGITDREMENAGRQKGKRRDWGEVIEERGARIVKNEEEKLEIHFPEPYGL